MSSFQLGNIRSCGRAVVKSRLRSMLLVKTCYRLLYKRGCQEHFSPSAGCAGLFRDIQPLSPWKTLVWCPAPGLFHRSSCIFFSSDDADQFRNAFKPYGCRVATMDLSEARGLVLFRVVRRGIGITRRLSVTDTCAPTGD